jgi:RNA polymerase sigma factor (sigma-70 family)
MNEHPTRVVRRTTSERTINELIENSSLGTEGARQLRARNTGEPVGRAHRLTDQAADDEVLDDQQLLQRHRDGDLEAFGMLIARHRDRMWAVAIRTLGEPEEAADALQEAFISAFRRPDSFRGDAKVTTWLHRMVVNACLDRLRRRRPQPPAVLPDDVTVTRTVDGNSRLDIINALDKLSADQRSALTLVDLEGYSIEEAAAILGCAPGTVKSRCARGRAKLLPLLRRSD